MNGRMNRVKEAKNGRMTESKNESTEGEKTARMKGWTNEEATTRKDERMKDRQNGRMKE